jgi:hypothetical protein
MADEIINHLTKAGVVIHDADIRKIVEEVQKHPDEVKQAFELMRDAFDRTAATIAHRRDGSDLVLEQNTA